MEPVGMELTSNRAVENAAITFAIAFEATHGRIAVDTRGTGAAADLQSTDRIIEVKAYGKSARGAALWLEPRQMAEALANPEFHLYVIDNIRQGDPQGFRLIDLHGEALQRILARAREKRYFEVPFPTGSYDRAIEPPVALV